MQIIVVAVVVVVVVVVLVVVVVVVEEVVVVVVVVDLSFTTLLTSQVISVAFYSESEKSDKFCSKTL